MLELLFKFNKITILRLPCSVECSFSYSGSKSVSNRDEKVPCSFQRNRRIFLSEGPMVRPARRKMFPEPFQSGPIRVVIRPVRSNWHQTEFRLVPNQSRKCCCSPNLVSFNKIQNRCIDRFK